MVTTLQERWSGDAEIDDTLQLLDLPFGESTAIAAGKLRNGTRHARLSLGDRACLALASERDATALTNDRAWTPSALR
ncbi:MULTISPECIES: PIN domain-containing protein [Sphingobium]|nr:MULTISPECIES: PIN domain-containing protein [Sphingobium]